MRLAKHSLPKEVHKHAQTVKHKKSAKKLERLETKRLKALSQNTVEMAVEGETPETAPAPLSEEERRRKRQERKKANAHKNMYKKQHLSFSAKNGPRAINRGSI